MEIESINKKTISKECKSKKRDKNIDYNKKTPKISCLILKIQKNDI